MAGKPFTANADVLALIGLSTETKPLNFPAGTQFWESDTGSVYIFDGITTWFVAGTAGTVSVGAVTAGDGAISSIGAKADVAWASGAGSEIAVLKTIAGGKYLYNNITAAAPTTTTVKSGAGFLHAIIINTPVATSVITIYDNTAGSGTKIGTITLPATVTDGPHSAVYDVNFTTGLTIVTSTAASDITVSYR